MTCLPSVLQPVLHRKVCSIAKYGDARTDALLVVATGGRNEWTLEEWNDLLRSLDACQDTLDDWYALNG